MRTVNVRCEKLVGLCISLALSAIGCSLFGQAGASDKGCDESVREGVGVVEMPLALAEDIPTVEAHVQGLDRPLRLAVDTGAGTIIRADLAREIASTPDRSTTGAGITGVDGKDVDADLVVLDGVGVGSMELGAIPAAFVASPAFDISCPPIDGLLGTAGGLSRKFGFLDRVAVEIDRDTEHLRLSLDGTLLQRVGTQTTLPLQRYMVSQQGERIDDGATWVPVKLEGRLFWAQLDTGAAGLSSMTRDVFTDLLGRSLDDPDVRAYRGVGEVGLTGAKSPTRSWIATVGSVQLGAIEIDRVPFRILEPRADGRGSIVLAEDLLRQLNMVLDYRRGELRLRAAKAPIAAGLPLQLSWLQEGSRWIVVGMLEDGAAARAGVRLDDEVLGVNDTSLEGETAASICAARLAWRHSTASELHLRLRRAGREFEVTLPRREPKLGTRREE